MMPRRESDYDGLHDGGWRDDVGHGLCRPARHRRPAAGGCGTPQGPVLWPTTEWRFKSITARRALDREPRASLGASKRPARRRVVPDFNAELALDVMLVHATSEQQRVQKST